MSDEFDRRWQLGRILLWWSPRSISIHYGGRRLLWVRDARRWPLLFSERNAVYTGTRFKKIGPWIVRR